MPTQIRVMERKKKKKVISDHFGQAGEEQGESKARGFSEVSVGKARQGRVNSLGLASLNNFGGF